MTQAPDDAWLRAQYVDARRTVEEIAAEIGNSPVWVNRRLRRMGVPSRAVPRCPRALEDCDDETLAVALRVYGGFKPAARVLGVNVHTLRSEVGLRGLVRNERGRWERPAER